MNLFHFTMQQLAPNPLRVGEGDPQTVRAYLHHWLHRHHHPNEPPWLLPDFLPSHPLHLDALSRSKLLADLAAFYELPLPRRAPERLSTLENLETYVQQWLQSAA